MGSSIRKHIVAWLKRQVKSADAKGIILGLSGGIDSCVAAALAKEALGSEGVLGLIMPIHSQPSCSQDAASFAQDFGIRTKTLDLSGVYDTFKKVLPEGKALVDANLKPRLRMAALYYYAAGMDYLVCGTGNNSEMMTGYFTKYGDGGVDLLPIARLSKTQVRVLARELGIPERLIAKPPTAGLWPGQTDEEELGVTYPELDDILLRIKTGRKQVAPLPTVRKVKMMVARSEHKRLGPKICEL